jgi:hypothetical protein
MGNIVAKYAFLPPRWDPLLVENYQDQLIWLTNKYGHVFPVYHYLHSNRHMIFFIS